MTHLLCLKDAVRKTTALLATHGESVEVTAGTGNLAWLSREIERWSAGVTAIRPFTQEDRTDYVQTVVLPADGEAFLDAIARQTRARGEFAALFDEPRARVWFYWQTLPLDDEVMRSEILRLIPNLTDDQVVTQLHELEATAKELQKA